MIMRSKRLVITTINPYGDMDNQLNCFNSWKTAGYSIKTYNAKKEAELLVKRGVSKEDIELIEDADTTYSENKKYLPKLLPIIKGLQKSDVDFIIGNSDIYAFHSIPLMGVLSALAPCMALTRREVLTLATCKLRDTEYYRGGLDLFYFSKQSVDKLVTELAHCKSAEQMAFGAPGWDYLVGALIYKKLSGKICDGAVIAHKYHKNTYSSLDSFGLYAKDISRVLGLSSSDPYDVAHDFAQKIEQQCRTNIKYHIILKIYFHPNNNRSVNDLALVDHPRIHSVGSSLENINVNRLKLLLSKVHSENDWGLANQFIPGCFIHTSPLTAKLFTLWNYLKFIEKENRNYTTSYPKGNLHGVAIKNCLKLPPTERDNSIFEVFATELINYNIFNKQLFDYLVWAMSNQTQLKILSSIKECIGDA